MKKSNLWWGLALIVGGVACLVCALAWETALSRLFCGFAGALIGPGAVQTAKYRKWSRPENAEAYLERMELEHIELQDERKELLRNKAGRYAYVLGLLLCAVSMVVFSVLGQLGIVAGYRLLVLFLGGFLLVQIAAGIWIYRALCKKY